MKVPFLIPCEHLEKSGLEGCWNIHIRKKLAFSWRYSIEGHSYPSWNQQTNTWKWMRPARFCPFYLSGWHGDGFLFHCPPGKFRPKHHRIRCRSGAESESRSGAPSGGGSGRVCGGRFGSVVYSLQPCRKNIWVVVSNIVYFYPYLGKWPNLTNIIEMDRNHQLDMILGDSSQTSFDLLWLFPLSSFLQGLFFEPLWSLTIESRDGNWGVTKGPWSFAVCRGLKNYQILSGLFHKPLSSGSLVYMIISTPKFDCFGYYSHRYRLFIEFSSFPIVIFCVVFCSSLVVGNFTADGSDRKCCRCCRCFDQWWGPWFLSGAMTFSKDFRYLKLTYISCTDTAYIRESSPPEQLKIRYSTSKLDTWILWRNVDVRASYSWGETW